MPPCRTFDHEVRGKYVLQVRVFDNGTPPMYSDSFVTVNIIEESKFAPSVAPLEVHIWSYQDDFPGAVIGSVVASDLDPYDRLSYGIVPASSRDQQKQSHLFEIDRNKGSVIALQGLDAGAYSLNVSVTDDKFTTFSQVNLTC